MRQLSTSEIPRLSRSLDVAQNTLIVGFPGSGKTNLLRRAYLDLLQSGLTTDSLVAIAPTRASSAMLRDTLAFDSARASRWPKARSIHGFAHFLLENRATPMPVNLLSGAQQQALLDELLAALDIAKLRELGFAPETLLLRSFRQEVRDLIDVAQQHQLEVADLEAWSSTGTNKGIHLLLELLPRYRQRLVDESLMDSSSLLSLAADCTEADSETFRHLGIQHILIDDLQDIPPAGLRLLAGCSEVAIMHGFGDPDSAVLGFRSASPEAFSDQLPLWGEANGKPTQLIFIESTGAPRGPALSSIIATLSSRIPTSKLTQHRLKHLTALGTLDDSASFHLFDSAESETRWLASRLRKLHLDEAIPWQGMAVVCRSRADLARLESEFSALGIPCRIVGQQLPLREQAAAGALIDLIWFAIAERPTAQNILNLMRSPLLGLSAIEIARLTRQLRELDAQHSGSPRSSEANLLEAFFKPAFAREIGSSEGDRLALVAEVVRGISAASSLSSHSLLTDVWQSLGLAKSWRALAQQSGPLGAAANRNLDSVIHLFIAARRFDERNPGLPAIDFIKMQRDLAVPEDAILPSDSGSRVALATPSSLVGRPIVLALPGLQKGLWPNPRPRGSMLGAAQLDEFTRGRADALTVAPKAALADERRMLYKCVGSTNGRLIVSARNSLDESPSPFFYEISGGSASQEDSPDITNLRQLVGELRREVLSTSSEPHAGQLRLLSDEGLAGAHPDDWQGRLRLSTSSISVESDQLTIFASQLEKFEVCPLHWFISTFGGKQRPAEASLGSIIHKAIESQATTAEEMWGVVEAHWSEMDFEADWLEAQTRRRAGRIILNLIEYLNHHSGELISAERPVQVNLDGVEIRGRIDRLEKNERGGIVIADVKTGKPLSKSEASTSRQLQLYQLAIAAEFPNEQIDGAQIANAGGENLSVVPQAPLDRLQIAELRDLVAKFALEMSKPNLRAEVSGHCSKEGGACNWLLGDDEY